MSGHGISEIHQLESDFGVRLGLGWIKVKLWLGSDQIIQHVLVRGALTPPQSGDIVLLGITADRGFRDRIKIRVWVKVRVTMLGFE
eukprot:1290578-Amorphochlora_amoeboformis.AAC.1